MKIKITCLLIFIAFGTKAQDEANTMLWKIEGNGAKPSYLFGTIHLMPAADFELREKTKKAFAETSCLAVEIDISNPGIQQEMMQYARMDNGKTLSSLISKTDSVLLDSVLFANAGMHLALLNTFKPFVVESFLMLNVVGTNTASYEAELLQKAQSNNVKIAALETVEEQMQIFDQLPLNEQVESLLKFARGDEDLSASFSKVVALYKKQNLNGLDELMYSYYENEEFTEALLKNRNQKWVPKIERLLVKQPSFIAVGAGHLPGKFGLLTLLREAGYSITPVLD